MFRFIARAVVLAVFACATQSQSPATVQSQATDTNDSVALSSSLRPEVRLRKLHLVRPDLIQYPIAFEIYC